jgi:hypothetical protein
VWAKGRFHEWVERSKGGRQVLLTHIMGSPSAVMCVEVKKQTGMHIWDNHRVITDETHSAIEESCTRMA